MKKIRLGIIGMGNMGNGHLKNIVDGKCPKVTVTAVCDIDPQKLESAKSCCRPLSASTTGTPCWTAASSTPL